MKLKTFFLAAFLMQFSFLYATNSENQKSEQTQTDDDQKSDENELFESAKNFIISLSDQYLQKLSDKNTPLIERQKLFQKALEENFEVKKIAYFTLGKYRKQMDQNQKKIFTECFKNKLAIFYTAQFETFGDIKLNVKSAQKYKEKKKYAALTVFSEIKKDDKNIPIQWKIEFQKKKKQFKIIDIVIDTIWMKVTLRDEIYSQIAKFQDVKSFLADFEKKFSSLEEKSEK